MNLSVYNMFLKSIKINKDIVLESNRDSQKKLFKVKKKTYKREGKPIINTSNPFGRQKYEMKTVIEKTFIIHKKDFQLDFKESITIIVGDNGCGKTHLLSYLNPKFQTQFYFEEEQRVEAAKEWLSNSFYTLSFIKQPALIIQGHEIHKNSFIEKLSKSKTTLDPIDVFNLWDMNESSNGENVLDFITSISTIKNSLIILDEPETSLSIKSQKYISEIFKILVDNSNQLIIITHSPIIMELSDEVYDFEKLAYVNREKYIQNQLK